MTPEERRACIEEIRILPDLVRDAIEGLNDARLDTAYREGGWTVRQVVHHIADSHVNAYGRMKLVLTERHPTLKPYDQDAWAELADYALPVDSSIALLAGLHRRWAAFLEAVPDEGWGRTAYHPEDGEVTLEGLLRSYARHGRHHVGQIEELRRSSGW